MGRYQTIYLTGNLTTEPFNINGQIFKVVRGYDGISPTVQIEKIENGTRVFITDAKGTHYFDVLDGVVTNTSLLMEQIESILSEKGYVVQSDLSPLEKRISDVEEEVVGSSLLLSLI